MYQNKGFSPILSLLFIICEVFHTWTVIAFLRTVPVVAFVPKILLKTLHLYFFLIFTFY